jgi:putative membrane protein
MYGFGWGGWLLGGLMMLLFLGGLIALVFFLIRAFGPGDQRRLAETGETAQDILKKRYARGEISKEEYEIIRHDLES